MFAGGPILSLSDILKLLPTKRTFIIHQGSTSCQQGERENARWTYSWSLPLGGGFPGGASGKEPACQCRRCKKCEFDPWTGKIPWRSAWQPTPVFLPAESHGQRSLAGTVHRVTQPDRLTLSPSLSHRHTPVVLGKCCVVSNPMERTA